jgi:hypothetical protein
MPANERRRADRLVLGRVCCLETSIVGCMDSVALWLLSQVVAPDAYASIRKQISDKGSFSRLQVRVHDATGMRLGRRYKRWLHEENTWNDLVARNEDAHRRLVDALTEAESRGILRRRTPDRTRALELVNATIGYFLPTLDPSFAVAVADARQEDRHRETMARFDARSSYEDRLAAIPPGPRRILAGERVDRSSAEKLVYAVTDVPGRA